MVNKHHSLKMLAFYKLTILRRQSIDFNSAVRREADAFLANQKWSQSVCNSEHSGY